MTNLADLNYMLSQVVPTAAEQSQQALSGASPAPVPTPAEVAAASSPSSTGLNVALSQVVPTAAEQSQQALSGASYVPPPLPPAPSPVATLGSSVLEAPVPLEQVVGGGHTWDSTREGVDVNDAYDYLRKVYAHDIPAKVAELRAHHDRLIMS